MPIDDFDLAIAPLKDLGGQRVWSLMISLFGDLARQEGQIIGGPVLSAIIVRSAFTRRTTFSTSVVV